jgi:deoxyribonuclease-4
MYFGAHVSTAGGIMNAPVNAGLLGCEVFQCFSRSPQGGPAPVWTAEQLESFFTECKTHAIKEWVLHAPYYINFASELPRTRGNSIRIIREELERGTILNASYVMFHPGSSKTVGRDQGLTHVVEGVKKVLDGYSGTTKLLIEISAGAGEVIGDTFEELAEILERVDHPELGICFDTAHAFASGYDLRTGASVTEVFNRFDATIGLHRLKMSHCNDSKVDLGERKDRHEHLGKGFIGAPGFAALVHHPKLQHLNWYLETDPAGVQADLELLKQIRAQ